MFRKAIAEQGVRTAESGVDPSIVPVEDQTAGDEGIDVVSPGSLQDQKEPLDPPQQSGIGDGPATVIGTSPVHPRSRASDV
jgi:hypothetical protein